MADGAHEPVTGTAPDALGLLAARRLHAQLAAPAALPVGDYRAVLLGPAWFRALARFGLALGGLPRWHGKRFRADGSGVNLLQSAAGGAPREKLPMQLSIAPSPADGRPVARVGYDRAARFPWPAVVDELRRLPTDGEAAEVWLGMARTDWRLTRGSCLLRLPFVLIRER